MAWIGGRRWAAIGFGVAIMTWSFAAAARDEALWAIAQGEKAAAVATLRDAVNLESHSRHEPGLRAIADVLAKRLAGLGAQVELVEAKQQPSLGAHVVGRLTGSGKLRLLLMAHMDTIYPAGTLAQRPYREEGGKAYGPGIADDKGGITVILHALESLKKKGFKDFAQITVLFNTDEEIGSRDSGPLIVRLASEADATLSFEPSTAGKEFMVRGAAGTVAVNVTVKGRTAHAGVEPERGRNALVEASDIVLRTQDLDEPAKFFRFTWTSINAGVARNQVPEEASLYADLRYFSQKLMEEKLDLLRARLAQRKVPDTEAVLNAVIGRPAYEADAPSRAIGDRAIELYREIGGEITVVERTTGGTDAGFAQKSGKPVIETMGLPGFGYHSPREEFVDLERIPARVYLAARLIMDLAEKGVPK